MLLKLSILGGTLRPKYASFLLLVIQSIFIAALCRTFICSKLIYFSVVEVAVKPLQLLSQDNVQQNTNVNIRGGLRTLPNIYDGYFCKIVKYRVIYRTLNIGSYLSSKNKACGKFGNFFLRLVVKSQL